MYRALANLDRPFPLRQASRGHIIQLMVRSLLSPREKAARALCRLSGVPENTQFEGRPMWQSFLPEVDAVLAAALPADEFARLVAEESR